MSLVLVFSCRRPRTCSKPWWIVLVPRWRCQLMGDPAHSLRSSVQTFSEPSGQGRVPRRPIQTLTCDPQIPAALSRASIWMRKTTSSFDLWCAFPLVRFPTTRSPASQATNHRCAGDQPGGPVPGHFGRVQDHTRAFFTRWLRGRRNISVDTRRVASNLRDVGRIPSLECHFRATGLCGSSLSHLPQVAWAVETLP